MAHTYMRFDFGSDEEKAQGACHKLDVWKQAFRLDKKLLYKLDREENGAAKAGDKPAKTEKVEAKASAKSVSKKGKQSGGADQNHATNGDVHLLVRLNFSSHEKLSEQRWLERIPSEEPFKSASPTLIRQEDVAEFEKAAQQFSDLELGPPRK